MQSKVDEILNITQEECGELVQIISKCKRFGLDETHLKAGVSNRQRLAEEAGDVMCMIQLLVDFGVIDIDDLESARHNKVEKLKQWSSIFVNEIKL